MFKDKLIFDVTEGLKLGQLKELGEASDNELVEIRNTAVVVLEHRESEEEDSDLEKADQSEFGSGDYVHLPDAPQVRAVHLSSIRRRKFLQNVLDA